MHKTFINLVHEGNAQQKQQIQKKLPQHLVSVAMSKPQDTKSFWKDHHSNIDVLI